MPLGSIPETRTHPSRMAGAMDTSGHHRTEPLPAPVAPAVRVCPPASGMCQSWPYSVRPAHTRPKSTAPPSMPASVIRSGQLTGSASRLRRWKSIETTFGDNSRAWQRATPRAQASARAASSISSGF
jgi:hypothetical protein